MRDIIIFVALIGLFLFGVGALNTYANNRAQARCEADGFTYARAALVADSLCIRTLSK